MCRGNISVRSLQALLSYRSTCNTNVVWSSEWDMEPFRRLETARQVIYQWVQNKQGISPETEIATFTGFSLG